MNARLRLTIPTRILLMLALVLSAFVGVSLWSLAQHKQTADTLRLLNEGYLPLALTVGEAKATQAVFGTVVDRVLSEPDPTATRQWLQVARRVRPAGLVRAFAGIERIEALEPPPEDRTVLNELNTKLESVRGRFTQSDEAYDAFFEALERGRTRDVEDLLLQIRAEERATEGELREARRVLQNRIATVSAVAAEQERQSAVLLGALTILGLLVGGGVLWLSYRMLAPLPRLERRVEAVARGDLSPIDLPRSDDELGRLADAFERMVGALAARDQRLREAAEAELALKRMQEEIVVNLNAALLVVDEAGTVLTANPAAERVLGVTSEAVGQPLEDTGIFERLPGLEGAMAEVRGGLERAHLAAAPMPRDTAVNVLVTPFVTEHPEDGSSLLLVADDVTEELRTKNRLIQTERLAAIGRMAAHVTHEVRNPLSSIGLNVDLLEEEAGAAGETAALLRSIRREIDRLTKITEEYLRLARLPQPSLEPEEVDRLVLGLVRFVGAEMNAAEVEIEVTVEEELPLVAIDEAQLRQALLNLLRNARESMPDGGRIEVALFAKDDGLVVRISDEGGGMEEETRERIFDLFYTTKKRGTGLGLPLTQQIVAAHGGKLECAALPGEGTTFELWFPRARPPTRPVDGGAADRLSA